MREKEGEGRRKREEGERGETRGEIITKDS